LKIEISWLLGQSIFPRSMLALVCLVSFDYKLIGFNLYMAPGGRLAPAPQC
jgi:hypothetical protein